MIRITKKEFGKIEADTEEWDSLYELSYDDGGFQQFLIGSDETSPKTPVFIAKDTDTGEIIGWSLAHKLADEKVTEVGVFVDESYRCQGIATRLIKKAVKASRTRRIKCYMHDEASAMFYGSKFGAEIYSDVDDYGYENPAEFVRE